MAKKLDFFTKYAKLLAHHVTLSPQLAKVHAQRFEYFCEDFGDAIDMASDEDKEKYEAAAREAHEKVKEACDEAGIL